MFFRTFEAQVVKVWELQGEFQEESVVSRRRAERERSYGGVELEETTLEIGRPSDDVEEFDGEGVNFNEGFEVAKVVSEGFRNESIAIADVDLPSVS